MISVLRRFFCDLKKEVIEDKLSEHIKILMLGDVGVGKTTIRSFYVRENITEVPVDELSHSSIETIGADYAEKYTTVDGHEVLLQIADVGGGLQFFERNNPFLLKSQGALIIFDLNNPKSFLNIPKWIKKLSFASGRSLVPFIVLGNKVDLLDTHPGKVTEIHIKKLMRKIEEIGKKYGFKATYWTVSGLEGTNIDEVFTKIAKMVITSDRSYASIKKLRKVEKASLPTLERENKRINEPYASSTDEERGSKPEEDSGVILVTRNWQLINDQCVFTVQIKNHTLWPINEILVRLIGYPESLRPLRKEMKAATIPQDGLGTFMFRLDTLETQIIGKIRAEAQYRDHEGDTTILVHPTDVLIFSDLLIPLMKTNEEVAILLQHFKTKTIVNMEAWGKPGVVILEHLSSLLPKRNFQILRKIGQKTEKGFIGRLLAGGSGKFIQTDVVLLIVDVIEHSKENSSVRLEAASSDKELTKTLIMELKELIEKEKVVPYLQKVIIS